MRYISTRGEAPALNFSEVLLAGLATDGGLYLPESWPAIDIAALTRDDPGYAEIAVRVMTPFVDGAIPADDFAAMVAETCAAFDDPAVAPLVPLGAPGPLGPDAWLLELFHGPTLAFKDHALQLLGRLFDYLLARRGERMTVVCATSGDTGSAAIEACRGRPAIEIFVLHPEGWVSDVQRRQMTTVADRNVHNLAIRGNFDDCQDILKALFADAEFRREARLSAVNSINWARVMAQIVYYVFAATRPALAGREPVFAVPTGNFGNVYAGYAASRCGLPLAHLAIGSNRNDILTRFLASGRMEMREVRPTLSPSMDIQVSSNFERLLFDLLDRDGVRVAGTMAGFRESGVMDLEDAAWQRARALFSGYCLDDDGTRETIRRIHGETGMLVDPHTAVGIAAGEAARKAGHDGPLVALATAHPAKFPDAVESATGIRPALPERLADLFDRPEHCTALPAQAGAVREHIRAATGLRGAA